MSPFPLSRTCLWPETKNLKFFLSLADSNPEIVLSGITSDIFSLSLEAGSINNIHIVAVDNVGNKKPIQTSEDLVITTPKGLINS